MVTIAHLSIILVFASLSSQLSQLTALSFNRVYSSHSHLSIVSSFPQSTDLTLVQRSVHQSHLKPLISLSLISLTTDMISTGKRRCGGAQKRCGGA